MSNVVKFLMCLQVRMKQNRSEKCQRFEKIQLRSGEHSFKKHSAK